MAGHFVTPPLSCRAPAIDAAPPFARRPALQWCFVIDIHAHILPALDDGAASLEDALTMAATAASAGTTDIVATPHCNPATPYSHAATAAAAAQLRPLLPPGLRLHTGCELHLTFENVQAAIANPEHYSYNGRGYLLLEFNDLLIPPNTTQILDQLLRVGLVPILAHPERNNRLTEDLARLKAWVHRGAYIQVTAMSLTGQFGSPPAKAARQLLDQGLAHFIASDAHDDQFRPARLDLAHAHLTAHYNADYADLLTHLNPQAVIEGRPMDPGPLEIPKKPRKWWWF